MSLTNEYAQKILIEAELKLQKHYLKLNGIDALRCEIVLKNVTLIRTLSASSNEIPGLRGLGLEQAISFCETYIKSEKPDIRSFNLSTTFKSLGHIL